VQLELVLDEGGVVMMDGISGPSFRLVEQVGSTAAVQYHC
jgi:hypothetical protein